MKLLILALLLGVTLAAPPHRDEIPEEVEDSEGDLEAEEPHDDGALAFPGVPHFHQSRNAPQLHRPAPPSVHGVKGSVGDKLTRPTPEKTGAQAGNQKQTADGKMNPKSGGNVKQTNKNEVNKKPQNNNKKNKPNPKKSPNQEKKSNTEPKAPVTSNSQLKKPNSQLPNDNTKQVAEAQGVPVQGSPSNSDGLKTLTNKGAVPEVMNLGGQTGMKNFLGQNGGVQMNGREESSIAANLRPAGPLVPVQTGSGLVAPSFEGLNVATDLTSYITADERTADGTVDRQMLIGVPVQALSPQTAGGFFNFGGTFKASK